MYFQAEQGRMAITSRTPEASAAMVAGDTASWAYETDFLACNKYGGEAVGHLWNVFEDGTWRLNLVTCSPGKMGKIGASLLIRKLTSSPPSVQSVSRTEEGPEHERVDTQTSQDSQKDKSPEQERVGAADASKGSEDRPPWEPSKRMKQLIQMALDCGCSWKCAAVLACRDRQEEFPDKPSTVRQRAHSPGSGRRRAKRPKLPE
jgi:hypothetical protein